MAKLTDNELFEIIDALAASDVRVSDALIKKLKSLSDIVSDELVVNRYHERRGTGEPLPTRVGHRQIDKPWKE